MDWPTDPINPGVRARLASLAAEFQAGRPFRHVVIDDFLVPEIAEAMLAEFPGCSDPSGLKDEFGEPNPRTTIADVRSLGGVYAALDQAIQTPAFLGAMEALAGIEGFRYDPGYFGGGTHESFSGAGLDPHCDFNVHPQTGQRRRVNVLVYLNKDWDPAWRGSLCLHSNPWDPEHDHISEVVPVFNRCIIFETSDTSWHSVLPVSLPDDKRHFSRKSFALYLYTDFLPGERKLIEHSTIYAQRGLAPHIKPGRTLTERDARDIRAGLERRDRHIRALYARETVFSVEITAMRAHIEELRRATYVPLVGYARIETIATGVHFDRFMGARLEFAMRLFRPALGLRLIAFRPADLGETMEIEMNVAGMRTHAAVTPGMFELEERFAEPLAGIVQVVIAASEARRPAGGVDLRELSIVIDRIELIHDADGLGDDRDARRDSRDAAGPLSLSAAQERNGKGGSMTAPQKFLSKLTGSFSQGAAENPTVAMVEAAFRHHGLDARYINCEVPPELLGDAVRGARAMGWLGFNCSIPHKVTVIEHLDGLGESARIMGAVNCAVRRGDKLIGENTDGKGFLKSLTEIVDPRGKKVVMFGAGGAARAIGVELALAGASEITVVNRSRERGEPLAKLLNAQTPAKATLVIWPKRYGIPAGTDIVVNATSIGLFPDVDGRLDLDLDSLKPGMVVADVIVNPPRTNLIREAEARGCTVLDGLGMLVNQGVIGIKYWTGVDVDPGVMRAKINEIFGV